MKIDIDGFKEQLQKLNQAQSSYNIKIITCDKCKIEYRNVNYFKFFVDDDHAFQFIFVFEDQEEKCFQLSFTGKEPEIHYMENILGTLISYEFIQETKDNGFMINMQRSYMYIYDQ